MCRAVGTRRCLRPPTSCAVHRRAFGNRISSTVDVKPKRTTLADQAAEHPADVVNPNFSASRPNRVWVADLTFIRAWVQFVYAGSSSMCSHA